MKSIKVALKATKSSAKISGASGNKITHAQIILLFSLHGKTPRIVFKQVFQHAHLPVAFYILAVACIADSSS